jgi:hypothetical protein
MVWEGQEARLQATAVMQMNDNGSLAWRGGRDVQRQRMEGVQDMRSVG